MNASTYSYAYDDIGNRQTSSVNAVASSYTLNSLNQYTAIAGGLACSPTYDLDGNMLTNGVWAYTWDGENRLTAVYSNATLLVSNVYDHQSRRIAKNLHHEGTKIRSNAFVWDGWNMIQEVIADNGSLATNSFTWGLDLSGTLQGAGGVGGLLAVDRDGAAYYPAFDANGNITEYVANDGTVAAHRECDAFGNTSAQSGPMADAFVYWFSTKYVDAETGMYYYGYRFYLPELGRWMNRDPEDVQMNKYAFCDNDNLNYFDVYGLQKKSPNDQTDWMSKVLTYSEGHVFSCDEWNRTKEGYSGKPNRQSYIKHFEIESLGSNNRGEPQLDARLKRLLAEDIVSGIGLTDNITLWRMNLGRSTLHYTSLGESEDLTKTCQSGKRYSRMIALEVELQSLDKFDEKCGCAQVVIQGQFDGQRLKVAKVVKTAVITMYYGCTGEKKK